MKKFVAILLVLAVVLSLGLAGCAKEAAPADEGTDAAADNTPIKIGYLTELSSALTVTYIYTDVSVKMWLDEVNAAGGICGRPVELVTYNAQNDTSIAIQRLEEAKADGCVCTLQVAVAGGHAPAIAKWCGQAKYVVNNDCNTATEVTITNHSKYYFNCSSNGWGIGKITAINLIGKMGYDTYVYVGVDEACCRDTELFLEREGQVFNPKCKELTSYTLGWDDPQFAPIIGTLLASQGDARPSFILQQGGGAFLINFVKQGLQYGLFDEFLMSNDFAVGTEATQPLVEAGDFPYGKTAGYGLLPFWDKSDAERNDWVARFQAKGAELGTEGLVPADISLTTYYQCISFELGLKAAIEAGADISDSSVLADYIQKVEWSDFQGVHHFRDFDNQLTFDAYFMTTKDGGEEFGHLPIGDNMTKYAGDEFLPTFEAMDAYAQEINCAGWYEW